MLALDDVLLQFTQLPGGYCSGRPRCLNPLKMKKTTMFGFDKGVKLGLNSCSRMRSEGSRFIWGCGGEAVFAESCVCVRNRSQPSATVRNRPRDRRKALHSGECVWSDPESASS